MKRFLLVMVALQLLVGLTTEASAARKSAGRRPAVVSAKGVSYDGDFNVPVYRKHGKITAQQYATYVAMRQAGNPPGEAWLEPGTYANYWVDRTGGLHGYPSMGRTFVVTGNRQVRVLIYGDMMLRNTCKNLIVGPPPVVHMPMPPPPVVEKPCAEFMICKKVLNGDSLAGFVFEVTYPDGQKRTFTTDAQGMVHQTGLAYGEYKFVELPREGYKLVHPTQMPIVRQLTRETKSIEVIVINEKCAPPPVESPCAEFMICKKVVNGDTLAGFVFEVTYPNGEKKTFTTDAQGMVHQTGLVYGDYTFVELPREGYKLVHPDRMPIVRRLTKETKSIEVIVINEKCAPPRPPEFNGEASQPPPPPVIERLPGRVSGYQTGRPFREVDRENVAGGGVYTRPRSTVSRTNRRVVINKRRFPPGKAPHGGGKTKDTDGDGNNPGGGGRDDD